MPLIMLDQDWTKTGPSLTQSSASEKASQLLGRVIDFRGQPRLDLLDASSAFPQRSIIVRPTSIPGNFNRTGRENSKVNNSFSPLKIRVYELHKTFFISIAWRIKSLTECLRVYAMHLQLNIGVHQLYYNPSPHGLRGPA